MKRVYALLILISFTMPGAAKSGSNADCVTTFYKTKSMECIDALAEFFENASHGDQQKPDPTTIIGFLARVFTDYPEKKEQILIQQASPYSKSIYLAALYRAGLFEDARKYAEANGWAEGYKKYQNSGMLALSQLTPTSQPGDNDLMIGAYMASGDTEYIKRILANYTTATDEMVSDALRLGLVMEKFGPTLMPKGRDASMAVSACQKYNCKVEREEFMRLMTLASAYWALRSLLVKDEGIRKTFVDYFEKNQRIKNLLIVETNAFSNYLINLIAYSGIKDNPNINSSLSMYESFASDKDIHDAMVKIIK